MTTGLIASNLSPLEKSQIDLDSGPNDPPALTSKRIEQRGIAAQEKNG